MSSYLIGIIFLVIGIICCAGGIVALIIAARRRNSKGNQATKDVNDVNDINDVADVIVNTCNIKKEELNQLLLLIDAKNKELEDLDKVNSQLYIEAQKTEAITSEKKKQIDDLNSTIVKLQSEISSNEKISIIKEKRLEELNNNIKKIQANYDDQSNKVNNQQQQIDQKHEILLKEQEQLGSLQLQNNNLQEENKNLQSTIEATKQEKKKIDDELDELKERKRLAVLGNDVNNSELFTYAVETTEKERKLIAIIREIVGLYPELAVDLGGIEWRKIWLPKLQRFTDLSGKRGIYRLVLKSDESVCYIGQAVDIKQRWYTHCKKMVGAELKGNEKLYEYRPEDFYWTVKEEGCADLNKAERYWIDFYGAREKGLNRK